MTFLLDTNVLLWAAIWPDRMPATARSLLAEPGARLIFSVVSVWEVAIKTALGRADFNVDPVVLRRGLLDNEYVELPVTGAHATTVARLPPLHRDPFDRLLIAQAMVEEITFLTADPVVARYPGPVRQV